MGSAYGKGRTILEILAERCNRKMTPLELQYNNPLEAKVGQVFCFKHEPELADISFVVEQIAVCEVNKKVHHTDYCLQNINDDTLRFRLRLVKSEDRLGYSFQLLSLHDEICGMSAVNLANYLQHNGCHDPKWDAKDEVTFKFRYDDEGRKLAEPIRYWRVNDAINPYSARTTVLVEAGKSEVHHREVKFWDFSRMAMSPAKTAEELLWIELDDDTQSIAVFKGSEIASDQVVLF